MSLFYRYLVSWIDDPNEPSAASVNIPVKDRVDDQYQKFTLISYDVNAAWLGKDTYDFVRGFSPGFGYRSSHLADAPSLSRL